MSSIKHDWEMDKWDDTIDAYLNGQLEAQELRVFEDAFAENAELSAEIEFRRELRAALLQQEGQQLRQRIQELTQNAETDRSSGNWKRWAIAASLIFVLGIVSYSFWPKSMKSSAEIFAAYYSPELSFEVMRNSTSNGAGMAAADWEQLYSTKQFDSLAGKLDALPDSLKNLDLLYLEAVALIETGKNDAALAQLDEILRSPNTILAGKTRYLKAIVLIKTEKLVEAKAVLMLMSNLTPNYKSEAVAELRVWIEEYLAQ